MDSATAQNREDDPICQLLFDTYIIRTGMINYDTIMAASHIIAERGRNNGFWRKILNELQNGSEDSERGCVRILGQMLSIDALARDANKREQETGEVGQGFASVNLGPEVITTLIARGEKADRFRVEAYAIALARARVPGVTNLFRMILRDETGKHYMSTAKFYAAVGLAQLGDPSGYAWLVENSGDTLPIVEGAWPRRIANNNVDTCCQAALRDLSGGKDMKGKAAWVTWWQQVDMQSLPKARVDIVDQL